MKNKLIYIIGGTIVASSLIFGGNAYAAGRGESLTTPAVFGTVEAVRGNEITVSGKRGKAGTPTMYTVDTSDARITAGYGQGSTQLEQGTLEVGDKVAVLPLS